MNRIGLSIVLTMALVVWSAWNIMWGGQHHEGIVKADGKGYFAHLPATLIYDDLNFGFFDSIEQGKYNNLNYNYDYRKTDANGSVFNKYFAGTAGVMLPFYLGGHLYATYSDYDVDGYSKPYKISISIAGLVYLLLTLLVWVRILQDLGISERSIALTLPIMVFGTNWYYYVVCEPAMSHVYTVFFISWFVLLGLRWAKRNQVNLPLMGFILGLIVWIRPINGIVLLALPFCFGSFRDFTSAVAALFKRPGRLALSAGMALAVVGIQLVIYKIQTGDFLIYSYEEEGFNFAKPEIFNILFSYKKGLFLYTPVMAVALLGYLVAGRQRAWKAVAAIFFITAFTYVVSAWWNWYYGGSFSSRVFLDVMVFFGVGMALLIDRLSTRLGRVVVTSSIVILVLFCQFQTYQYRRNIIHWDNMDQQKYWEVFLDFSVFGS